MPPKTLLSLVGCACVLASLSLPVAAAAEPSSPTASTSAPSTDRSTEMPLPGGGKVVLSSQDYYGSFREQLTYHPPQGKPVRLWNALPYELYHPPTRLITANRVGDQVLVLLEEGFSYHQLIAWQPGSSSPTGFAIESALLHQVTHAKDRKITLKSARELELTYSSSQPPLLVTASEERPLTLKATREPGGPVIDVTHLALPLDAVKPALAPPGYETEVCAKRRLNNGLLYLIKHPAQPGEFDKSLVWLPNGGRPEMLQRTSGAELRDRHLTLSAGFATDHQIAIWRGSAAGLTYYQGFTKTQDIWQQTAFTPIGSALESSGTQFTGIQSFLYMRGGRPPRRFEVLDHLSPGGAELPLITCDGELIPLQVQNWGAVPLPIELLTKSGINAHSYIDFLPLGTTEVRVVRAPKNGGTMARLILHPGRNGALALTGKDDALAQGPWRFLTGSLKDNSAEFVVVSPSGQSEYWRFAPSPSTRGWPLTEEAKLDDLNVAQLLQAKFTAERKLDCLWEDGARARYEFPGSTDVGNTSPTLRTAVRSGL
ncbi:hypothetical protein [Verrucomicrobium sp. BvORR106]|uniref:hypothetical protein n=1 Tax=Verrucomicrobium sp. BvORR106 TaxID=1403819 RepID=UPI000B1BE7AE|nr:hypothetical protein [Verrucomicrobium sp. BvORR106]